MRVTIIQQVAFEGPGALGRWAAGRGASVTVVRPFAGEALPAADAQDLLVLLGGPMGADDEALHPWLRTEKTLALATLAAGGRVLGLCLGAQLLARALGAPVTANQHREIGWYPVTTTAAGRPLALLAEWPPHAVVFHWHGDTFALPAGATPLFASAACPAQGFLACQGRALALQFHPEIDGTLLDAMLHHEGADLDGGGPSVQTRADIAAGLAHAETVYPAFVRLLDRFMGQP
jgi:GMP synthase-like glutamine amidotransferase